MDARKWVAILATLCGLMLGIGIPLLGLTALPHTEVVEGYVVWVRSDQHALLVYDVGPHDRLRGRRVLVFIPERRNITVQPGNRPLSVLHPGNLIRTHIGHRSHWARDITLER